MMKMKSYLIIATLLIQVTPCWTCVDSINTNNIQLNLNSTFITILNPACKYQQVMINIPTRKEHTTFLTVQLHTQYQPISLSYNNRYSYGETYNSSNPGILQLLDKTEKELKVYIRSNSIDPVPSSLFAIGYTENAPIPGGCCLTCAMNIDPNIEISYRNGMAYLFFHRASQYYYPPWKEPSCDNGLPSTYKLKYEIYYLYIKDLSKKAHFDAIWKMSSPSKIQRYGVKLSEISGSSLLKLVLQPVKGQGIVFNVIVHDINSDISSAYIPISTYNCKFDGQGANCYSKTDTTSIVYCAVCAVIGLALCVAGLKLLPLLLFIIGWLFYWLFIYVIIYCLLVSESDKKENNMHALMIMSSLCAICGGVLTLFFYAFQKLLFLSFITLSLFTGMFIGSIIFYSPIGHLSFWVGDDKFVFAFCCISIVLATFFFFTPKFLSIFSSCMIGSYALILVPNYFFNGTLQYVILVAVLRLSTSPDFFLERPYYLSDYILAAVWVLLFIIGVILQHFTTLEVKMDVSTLYFNSSPSSERSVTSHIQQNNVDPPAPPPRPVSSASVDHIYVPTERTPLCLNDTVSSNGFLFNTGYTGGPILTSQPTAPPRPPSPPPPYSFLPEDR